MSKLSCQGRRCSRRDTMLALGRATLFFGTVALVTALIVQPGGLRTDRLLAEGSIGLDRMETGSIGMAQPMRIESGRGPAPCLELPDGSRRGAC